MDHPLASISPHQPDLPPQVGVLVQLTKDVLDVGRILQHIAALLYVNREAVPADVIENERRVAERLHNEGKPTRSLRSLKAELLVSLRKSV